MPASIKNKAPKIPHFPQMFKGKSILVTGGTGSFGRHFCAKVLKMAPSRVIVYSRDEFKQHEMQEMPTFYNNKRMRYFLGDIRDDDRLKRAMQGVDIVVHAAALKQVPAAEYNPNEFIKTNVNGATNIVDAALHANVPRVIALSTDKAVNPVNLYGATKLCSDKVFIAGNSYRGNQSPTLFSVVRYGNVIGSRGSVIPLFIKQRDQKHLTITNPDMTRFYITLEEGVLFVMKCLQKMVGGELFIPKLPSCTLGDMAHAVAPNSKQKIVGLRPGEKMHETLIPSDEAHLTIEYKDYYVIQPTLRFWTKSALPKGGKKCPSNFAYTSDNNPDRLTIADIKKHIQHFENYLPHNGTWQNDSPSIIKKSARKKALS